MRLALFSPLNPVRSGVSDYTEELLPSLAEHADVDVFVDGFIPTNPHIAERFAVRSCAEYPSLRARRLYTANVYQMGNSIHHQWIYRMLVQYPGIVVLHEVVLHHFFLEIARRGGDGQSYLRELAYALGPEGIRLGVSILQDRCAPPLFDVPLVRRIADVSLGIIVHSHYARQQLVPQTRTPVTVIPAPVAQATMLSQEERQEVRAALGFLPGTVVVGAFGHATPAKRLDVVLRVLSRIKAKYSKVHLFVVGEVTPPGWLDDAVAELRLADAVTFTGAVPFGQLQRYIQAADICVNLRYPTAGETSASLLRCMAAGLPCIVSDVGAFAEVPDDCCYKICVGEDEDEQLYRAFLTLCESPEERRRVGEGGQAFVLQHHSVTAAARRYVSFVDALRLATLP